MKISYKEVKEWYCTDGNEEDTETKLGELGAENFKLKARHAGCADMNTCRG